jgi:hypothetical protein
MYGNSGSCHLVGLFPTFPVAEGHCLPFINCEGENHPLLPGGAEIEIGEDHDGVEVGDFMDKITIGSLLQPWAIRRVPVVSLSLACR